MAAEADAIRAASRWRPRPLRLRCLRPSGETEVYAVPDGRRAWTGLRRLVPTDALEVVGEVLGKDGAPVIVGRWTSGNAAAAIAAAAEQHDDEPPCEDALNFRWAVREVRAMYGDILRANREALAVVTEALRVQRDSYAVALANTAPPSSTPRRDDDDDEDDRTFQQITSLLRDGLRLAQAERGATSSPSSPIEPPRESP